MLIETSGASAGAVCLLDAGEQTLRLVNEVGLSDEGCRQLRKIGHPGSQTWSGPLDGLIERRIRVFERAVGHDLPPLVDPHSSMNAVACLPVLLDEQPRASVVLVALAPARFDVGALDDLAPALQEVAQILGTIGRSGADATPTSSTGRNSAETGGLAARARELLESLLRMSAAEATSAETGTGATDEIMRTEPDELVDGQEAVERAHEAELGHLTARLVEAARQWAHEHSLRIEQQHRFERARTHADAERDETVRRALQLIETTEMLRSSAVAEAEALRNQLAEAERLTLAAQDDARRARARGEASEATAATAREESEQLSRALDDARAAAAEAASRRGELEAELRALAGREGATRARAAEAEGRWQSTLAEVQRALASAEQRAAETDRERTLLAARLEEAVARERQLRDEREAVVPRVGKV